MNHESSLSQSVSSLLLASGPSEVPSIMDGIFKASDYATPEELKDALAMALQTLRSETLKMAQEDYTAHPELFAHSMKGLLKQLPILSGQCPDSTPRQSDYAKMQHLIPLLDGLAHCKTPESVCALVEMAVTYVNQHAELQEVGPRRLLRAVEDEILAQYLPVFLKKAHHSAKALYTVSLLVALENAPFPPLVFRLLHYNAAQNRFSAVVPDGLFEETNVQRLEEKTEILRKALPHMSADIAESYLAQLQDGILNRFIEWLEDSPDTYQLPEHTHTCIGLLKRAAAGELDSLPLNPAEKQTEIFPCMLGASNMIYNLGVEQEPEFLLNSWQELCNLLQSSPVCREPIAEHAAMALTSHILSGVAAFDMTIPAVLEHLLRLYIALGASIFHVISDDTVFSWVQCRNASV